MSDYLSYVYGDAEENELVTYFDSIAVKEDGTKPKFEQINIDTRYIIYKNYLNENETINNLILLFVSWTESVCKEDGRKRKHYTFSFYKVDDNNIKKIEESPLDFWNDDDQITIRIDTCFEDIENFIEIDDKHTVYQSEYGLNSLAGGKTKKTKQHRRKTMKRKTKNGGKQNKTKGIARRRRRRQIEK